MVGEASAGRHVSRPASLLLTTAAPDEGRGHLVRSLTLAEAVVARGGQVAVQVLRGTLSPSEHAAIARLGVELHTGRAPLATGDACVVVDMPDPNDVAPSIRPERLVVFDDSERLRSPAAVVVQPSLPGWRGRAVADRVLAGYAWAPVRASVRARAERPRPTQPDGLVVCFGGSDPADVTARLVPALAAAVGDAAMTVIVGPGYRGTLGPGGGWRLLRDPGDIDERLAAARLALIGAGTMKFELAALGVPMATLAVADDQVTVGSAFALTGASHHLGDGRAADPAGVAAAVAALLRDERTLAAMGAAGRAAVDGRGADRLAGVILEIAG
jgi:UDP-2,4-diacetamido-2,4,6-trideoxy-beta-L-altropyranose hydrolase